MVLFGILTLGTTRQISSFSTSRKCAFCSPKSPLYSLVVVSVSDIRTQITARQWKPQRMRLGTSMPSSASSLRHSRSSQVALFISPESLTGYGIALNTFSTVAELLSLCVKGRYLPVFASYIHDQNRAARSKGLSTINLKSVLIGNGITDVSTWAFHLKMDVMCLLTKR